MSYYDRNGNAISSSAWSQRLKSEQRVAEKKLDSGYWVSTVWLGLDHSFGGGPPLIFETMVFTTNAAGEVSSWGEVDSDRYSTEEEALRGHEAMVEKWSIADPYVPAEDE